MRASEKDRRRAKENRTKFEGAFKDLWNAYVNLIDVFYALFVARCIGHRSTLVSGVYKLNYAFISIYETVIIYPINFSREKC